MQSLLLVATVFCWAPPPPDATRAPAATVSTCDVDRVALTDLSAARFESEYHGVKPVIVTDATVDWAATERWRKSPLVRDHGDARIELGHPAEIIAFGGTGSTFSTLGQFISSFGNTNAAKDRLMFDSSEILQQRPELRAQFVTPTPFVRMMTESMGRAPWQMLSIGDDGAGLSFHSHGDSWLGLVHGRKRWLLYPPGGAPRQLFESLGPIAPPMHEWVRRSLPKLPVEVPSPLVDCLQKAGEAVYVPAGWLHATVNLGETIGAGGQAHWFAAARRDLMMRTRLHDAEVHRNLAIANHHLGQKQLALQHVQRALELGHSEDVSLKIKLVEELGAAGRQAEAKSTALQTLASLDKLASSVRASPGSICSSNLAAFYYALASTMASVGVASEELQDTFERALELAQGIRSVSAAVVAGAQSPADQRLSVNGVVEGEYHGHKTTPGGEESAMACRIAFQLAMAAGKQQRWHDAARWLREALRVPRALSQQHTTKALRMLPEAETRAGHVAARVEHATASLGQEQSPSQPPHVGKLSRREASAQAKRRRARVETSAARGEQQ